MHFPFDTEHIFDARYGPAADNGDAGDALAAEVSRLVVAVIPTSCLLSRGAGWASVE